jgi:hypothetical protein
MRRCKAAQEPVARELALRRRQVRRRGEMLLSYADRPLRGAPPADVPVPDTVLRGGAVGVRELPMHRKAEVEIPVLVRVERLVVAADRLECLPPDQRRGRKHRAEPGERAVGRAQTPRLGEGRGLRLGLVRQRLAALADHLGRSVHERRARIRFERVGEARRLPVEHQIVGVEEAEKLAAGRGSARVPRRSRVAERAAHDVHGLTQPGDLFDGSVRRACVDDDHLGRQPRWRESGPHRLDEQRAAVERGNDDAHGVGHDVLDARSAAI